MQFVPIFKWVGEEVVIPVEIQNAGYSLDAVTVWLTDRHLQEILQLLQGTIKTFIELKKYKQTCVKEHQIFSGIVTGTSVRFGYLFKSRPSSQTSIVEEPSEGRSSLYNLEKGPSDEWFQKFYKRHPELSERKAENQDRSRTRMSNPKVATEYFTLLQKVLGENSLTDKPAQIYNCDETGWSGKEAVRTKVVGPKTGHVFSQKVTTTDHITGHLCVCADGTFLPSMVIFKGSLPHRTYNDGIPDSWLFAFSENGYMDGDLFYQWFEKIFLVHCCKQRPVLLIMDNHDSHITLKVIEKAIENDVILMGLPAHTTLFLQPLDVKIIGPLKGRFSSIASRLGFVSQRLTIGKSKFPVVLKYSVDQTTPASIQNAFRETGIQPFNPDAIDKSQLVPSSFDVTQSNKTEQHTSSNTICETCGFFLANPLVSQGLIPQRMANILVPPPSKPFVQKKTRMVPSARVLTGEEMLMQLKEKEQLTQKKKQEMETRKRNREVRWEEKQKEVEETKLKRQKKEEEKQKKTEKKTVKQELKRRQKEEKAREKDTMAERIAASYVCSVCGVHGKIDDEVNDIFWYGCDEDMCGRWYHEGCLSEKEREDIVSSMDDGVNWYCMMCKPWLYEE